MTRVKVCGIRSPEQTLAAAEAGADFVGLMFAPGSRRRIEVEDACDIVRALGAPLGALELDTPPALYRSAAADLRSWFEHGAAALERMLARKRPLTVGVFAGQHPDEVNEIADECNVDLIQLSGGEPWSHCLLAARQVIKVVHVADGEDAASTLERIEAGSAMAVMLDRAVAGAMGGTGTVLDWKVAVHVAERVPVWLAGGLTPQNVATAIQTVGPWCVDVSSGVETDGVKDPGKIRAFIAAAKAAT